MTFEELFVKSAKLYFKGESFDETEKLSPNRKYTKEYFDQMEEKHGKDTKDGN